MDKAFEALSDGLDDKQKAEFYQVMLNAGLSADDGVLAKLLRALQLYKAYYAEIPEAIQKAVLDVRRLTRRAERVEDAGKESLNQILQHAAQVDESLKRIHLHIEEATEKASASVSSRMADAREKIKSHIEDTSDQAAAAVAERMAAAMEKALPLAELTEAGKVFSDVVASGRQASSELNKNLKAIRRAHYFAYALAAVALVLVFWAYTHFRYETRLEKERAAIVAQVDGNQAVLLELARSKRRLELANGEKGSKMLVIRNATGWTSAGNHGVIEFKE